MNDKALVNLLLKLMEEFRGKSMQYNILFARKNNLSMSQMGTMFHLYRWGSCGISIIGDHMGISTAAVSQMLERLVQQGLVQRTEDADDRRAKVIALTEKGHDLIRNVHCSETIWLQNLVNELDAEEKQKAIETFTILSRKLSQMDTDIEEMRKPQSCCD
jgi:MarR family transcriptional regulator for hemolysin